MSHGRDWFVNGHKLMVADWRVHGCSTCMKLEQELMEKGKPKSRGMSSTKLVSPAKPCRDTCKVDSLSASATLWTIYHKAKNHSD
jgi:hypothetical protein